jgi:ABC-type multidrug transport system permease subunit
MKKYNKLMLHIISISYIILTIIELIKYILTKSNVFGLIYLIICSFIIFLLVPTTVNYRDKKSISRIIKLCIVILF